MSLIDRPVLYSRKTLAAVFAIFATIVFFAYFRRFGQFGFYSDDAAFFGGAMNRSWREEFVQLIFSLTRWPQGRPLGMGVNLDLIPFLVLKFGGLPGLHLVAWIILSANMYLVWQIVGRTAPPVVAFAAAGFYGLCPAHTVQLQLVWAYNTQLALLCALGAVQAGLSRRWAWYACGVAATTLMAEPAAMVALAWPALATLRPSWPALRCASVLILIWGGVVGTILIARKHIGDPTGQERVGEITARPWETLHRSMESATTGPLVHLQLAAARLIAPLRELDREVALTMALTAGFSLLGALLIHRASRQPHVTPLGTAGSSPPNSKSLATHELWQGLRLVAIGFLIMVAVYASFFRDPWHPANWKTGFMSGVHLAAVAGSCLVFAGLIWLIGATNCKAKIVRQSLVISSIFALFSGFGVLVQRDYAASWAFQRSFWKVYGELCRDAGDRTYVLVLDHELPSFRFVDRSSWTTEVLPGGLFDYDTPASLPPILTKPSVIFVAPEPADSIRRDGDRFFWKSAYYFMLPKGADQQPVTGNVIILDHAGGSWHLLTGGVPVDGGSLLLKGPLPDVPSRPLKPLASLYGL